MPARKGERTPRRRKPARYHHGNLRPVLLDVASDILVRDGPGKLSLRAVARAADVSQSAPFNHFADREALLAALAEKGFLSLSRSMEEAIEAARPRDNAARLRALGRGYIKFATTQRAFLELMFSGVISDFGLYPDLVAAGTKARMMLEDTITGLQAEGYRGRDAAIGPQSATVVAWAMVHGLSALLAEHMIDPAETEAGSQDALIEQMLGVVLAALRPEG